VEFLEYIIDLGIGMRMRPGEWFKDGKILPWRVSAASKGFHQLLPLAAQSLPSTSQ